MYSLINHNIAQPPYFDTVWSALEYFYQTKISVNSENSSYHKFQIPISIECRILIIIPIDNPDKSSIKLEFRDQTFLLTQFNCLSPLPILFTTEYLIKFTLYKVIMGLPSMHIIEKNYATKILSILVENYKPNFQLGDYVKLCKTYPDIAWSYNYIIEGSTVDLTNYICYFNYHVSGEISFHLVTVIKETCYSDSTYTATLKYDALSNSAAMNALFDKIQDRILLYNSKKYPTVHLIEAAENYSKLCRIVSLADIIDNV